MQIYGFFDHEIAMITKTPAKELIIPNLVYSIRPVKINKAEIFIERNFADPID